MKKVLVLFTIISLITLSGCSRSLTTSFDQQSDENITLIYEAVFLDNDEIINLFSEVRGPEAPYEHLTKDFHVTTVYMPEKDMHELYGTEVTVNIYAYQDGEVIADDGSKTANEGFFCTVTTDNKELQSFFDNSDKNWHITGSYKDKDGAKYTEYLNLTDAKTVTYVVKGRLGGGMSNGSINFSPEG